jgi:hypothetical protein
LEAGKKRLAGDTARAATSDEVLSMRSQTQALHSVGGETRATGGRGGSTLQAARVAAKHGRRKNWRILYPKRALVKR